MEVSQNKGTPGETVMHDNPYYRDPQEQRPLILGISHIKTG